MAHVEFVAPYTCIPVTEGVQYTFYCELTGMAVYTTNPIRADTKEQELAKAKEEARIYFNRCTDCGRWVGDLAYNINEMKCIDCSPYRQPPNYCDQCGHPISKGNFYCTRCGHKVTI